MDEVALQRRAAVKDYSRGIVRGKTHRSQRLARGSVPVRLVEMHPQPRESVAGLVRFLEAAEKRLLEALKWY